MSDVCCVDDCCGPGSWCCARANPHDHDEDVEPYQPPVVDLVAKLRESIEAAKARRQRGDQV